jgi:hypothetical protein
VVGWKVERWGGRGEKGIEREADEKGESRKVEDN